MPKFSIAGHVYDASSLDSLTLHDILLFEQQTADMGRKLDWATVTAWADELDALDEADRSAHPGVLWITGVMIWASRRVAGEAVSFTQAVDFPMKDLIWLPDPTDRREPANPTRARPKRRAGSGHAAKPAAAAETPAALPSPQTSEPASIAG